MNGPERIRNVAFPVAMLLTLGFGTAQALASPRNVTGAGNSAMACSPDDCSNYCYAIGADFGVCKVDFWGSRCVCYYG